MSTEIEPAQQLSENQQQYWQKLKPKQKRYVNEILKGETDTGYEIVQNAGYNVSNKATASVMNHENLRNPNILNVLAEADTQAQDTIRELMQHSNSDKIRLNAAQDILDRIHGKATQKTEVKSQHVNISLDLSGSN